MNKTKYGVFEYIRAFVTINNTPRYLGMFRTEEEAACVHDLAAYRQHGEYARLNFPDKIEEYKHLISEGNEKG